MKNKSDREKDLSILIKEIQGKIQLRKCFNDLINPTLFFGFYILN